VIAGRRACPLLLEAFENSEPDRIRDGTRAEPLQHAHAVHLHGAHADTQCVGDYLVRIAEIATELNTRRLSSPRKR
jgi:hypothetical protein